MHVNIVRTKHLLTKMEQLPQNKININDNSDMTTFLLFFNATAFVTD